MFERFSNLSPPVTLVFSIRVFLNADFAFSYCFRVESTNLCVSLESGFVIDSLQQLFWCQETKADKVKEWWPVGSGHNDPASSHILFYCGTDFCFPRSALPILVSISPVFILVASHQLSDLFYLSSHFLALHCLWYLYNFFVFHFRTSETLQRIYFPGGIVATDHKSTVSSW